MQYLFWLLILIIFFIYIGYPIFLGILSYKRIQNRIKKEYFPSVTLIIAAHNEEQVIENKIESVLSQDYPKDKLQIVVASDASTDRTNQIVRYYSQRGIELYDQKEHKGKSAALNYAVQNIARGEIIVFNDATTLIERDAIRKITSYFSDDKIGAVAGKLIFKNSAESTITENYSLYWRYEEFLRESESKIGYLPFVSGAFYAVRKRLYTPVAENLPDDSVSPLGVYKQGFTVAYAKDAVAYEAGAQDAGGEFRIKTRGVVRELSSILHFRGLLNPFKYPALSLVLISHRLLRWSAPIFLIALFLANIGLLGNPLYMAFFWMQISFYLLALCGLFIRKKIRIVGLPFYFSLVNIAALWGIIKFLSGRKVATWKSVR